MSVLIPFGGTDPQRAAVCGYVTSWWEAQCFDVVVGRCEFPWRKAVAVADAVRRSDGEVLVVADADVITDPFAVRTSVNVVAAGAAWSMPHGRVHRLDRAATDDVLGGIHPAATKGRDQSPYRGWSGGGIVVLRRTTWHEVPMDRRFEGWSGEDESWACALSTLAGPCVRLDADLFHLWHPPQPRLSRRWGSVAARSLSRRYRAATGDPDAMRRLVAA